MLSGFQSLLLGSSYYTKWGLEVVVATDLSAHLADTDMQSDKATDDKPAKAEPPRCPYCGTTEAPIFVRAHLECPKCHTVIESCCDGGRCG